MQSESTGKNGGKVPDGGGGLGRGGYGGGLTSLPLVPKSVLFPFLHFYTLVHSLSLLSVFIILIYFHASDSVFILQIFSFSSLCFFFLSSHHRLYSFLPSKYTLLSSHFLIFLIFSSAPFSSFIFRHASLSFIDLIFILFFFTTFHLI